MITGLAQCRQWLGSVVLVGLHGLAMAAEQQASGVIGQHDFLFYRYELAQASDAADTQASLTLLAKLNRQLARNGVALALVLVPSKVRIYAEYLPQSLKLDPYTDGKYAQAAQYLRQHQVALVDLNQAFLKSPLRFSDTPLFLRLDTHWSPAGAMVAAQAVQATILQYPDLKRAWEATPVVPHTLTWASSKVNKRERDLVHQLPKGSPEFAMEQILLFKVSRNQASGAGLLLDADAVGITAIGSSYSDAGTLYPDALRHTLQRDLLDISIPVLRGPWVGMENYVQDAAFQRSRPGLLIWEIPERELRSPPNYRFREPRYISDNTEWLLRTAAWVQKECDAVKPELTPSAVAADSVRFDFATPAEALDYLRVSLPANHARQWQLEALGKSGDKRVWSVSMAQDEQAWIAKLALPPLPGGVQQLRISAPGVDLASHWQLCRLPADLLDK